MRLRASTVWLIQQVLCVADSVLASKLADILAGNITKDNLLQLRADYQDNSQVLEICHNIWNFDLVGE